MPRKIRGHLPADVSSGSSSALTNLTPKHLTKQEFGRRLYTFMLERGWNQSDLARHAGIARDRVSTYVRGLYLPTPDMLAALANTLNVEPTDLLPNYAENAIDNDHPSLEMKISPSDESKAWLRVNRMVSVRTAVKVIELLEADNAPANRD